MNIMKKLMLQKHREKIVRDLEAKDILDELYSEGILTSEDIEKVRNEVSLLFFKYF